MPRKEVFEAVCTMIGFIIGAGILGIPFVVARAGFLTGLLVIVVIGFVMMVVNLYIGEVNLRTKLNHQLTGLARIYLGRPGRNFMLFSMVFGIYGALTAYTIELGNFARELLLPLIVLPQIVYSLIFFAVLAFMVYLGLECIERSETIMMTLVLFIVALVAVFTAPHISSHNLSGFNPSMLLLPFGVVVFAYLGTASVPEVREELRLSRHDMKKTIIIGSAIPIAAYSLFALIVVGVTGIATTESAMIGLRQFLGYKAILLGLLFGVFSMSTSFLAVGLALKEMYMFDFRLKNRASSFLVAIVPLAISLVIILLGIKNAFYRVINITGALAGGVDIIIAVLMHWKAKELSQRSPEFSIPKSRILGSIIILIALAGIVYALLSTFGFL